MKMTKYTFKKKNNKHTLILKWLQNSKSNISYSYIHVLAEEVLFIQHSYDLMLIIKST